MLCTEEHRNEESTLHEFNRFLKPSETEEVLQEEDDEEANAIFSSEEDNENSNAEVAAEDS